MFALRFDGAGVKPGCRGPDLPLDEEAARLLERLRAHPLPEDAWTAAAQRL